MFDFKTQQKLKKHKNVEFKTKIDGLYCRLQLWWDEDFGVYFVSFIVHKSRRLANDWTRKECSKFPLSLNTTGNGEIKALLWAKNILIQLGKHHKNYIESESTKHLRVYKWLTRYGWYYHFERLISPFAKHMWECRMGRPI